MAGDYHRNRAVTEDNFARQSKHSQEGVGYVRRLSDLRTLSRGRDLLLREDNVGIRSAIA